MKGRWTGGARRHEKPQLQKRMDRKLIFCILSQKLQFSRWSAAQALPARKWPSQWEIGLIAWQLMCTAGNVTMTKKSIAHKS